MEFVLTLIAIVATVAVAMRGVMRMRTDTRGIEQHEPSPETGISDDEWDRAIR